MMDEIPRSLKRALTPTEQDVERRTLQVCLDLARALDPTSPICQALKDLIFMEERIESSISGATISGGTI